MTPLIPVPTAASTARPCAVACSPIDVISTGLIELDVDQAADVPCDLFTELGN